SRSYSAISLDSIDQSQSDTDSDIDAIFTDSGSESDPTSDSKLSSEGSGDDESDSNNEYLNNEGQLLPEHYIAKALNLDVSQLRQKRYNSSVSVVIFVVEKIADTALALDTKAHLSHSRSSSTLFQIIALVATQKGLKLTRRPKKNIYIEDVAKFARLAAITTSRPGALLGLRYRDLTLTLIRDLEGGRSRLFIFLTLEFTKKFLGKKAL
ncbi:uncharacterized protein N7458_008781, partial [Penicillium daleae]